MCNCNYEGDKGFCHTCGKEKPKVVQISGERKGRSQVSREERLQFLAEAAKPKTFFEKLKAIMKYKLRAND